MGEDFLLKSEWARRLYHGYAEGMPIFDYHCHLSPKEIAGNKQFSDLGELFLAGDHYKWRAMAAYGVPERLIRGDASFREKFMAFAEVCPMMIGSPLFHWTHLELKRVFGIDEVLSKDTAEDIYERASALLNTEAFRAQRLIERFSVRAVVTTDDPVDSLYHHETIARTEPLSAKVLPAFRPDKALSLDADYLLKLSAAADADIRSARDVAEALKARAVYFHAHGCRISDHSLSIIPDAPPDERAADQAVHAVLSGKAVSPEAADAYRAYLLTYLSGVYKSLDWTQQYHIGALRNNNSRMFSVYGPDAGYDSIDDRPVARPLSALLNAQESQNGLPRTILYSVNAAAHYALSAMTGNFQTEEARGKVQLGSGWWFQDQRDGMLDQLKTVANTSLLSTFVGMLTDSRSFVSYPRHEYFRRILCNLIGSWVEDGEYPADEAILGKIVRDICYNNAVEYFRIDIGG